MFGRAYIARRVRFHKADGGVLDAITFVMDRGSASYASALSLDEKARIIAEAEGFIGTSFEYLEKTHDSLQALGIRDGYLERIRKKVSEYRCDMLRK